MKHSLIFTSGKPVIMNELPRAKRRELIAGLNAENHAQLLHIEYEK
jgi:hypothetical protein